MDYDTNVIKGLIKTKGYRDGDVAKLLGLSHTTFSKKLNGKATFKIDEAIKLSQILNTGLDAMFLQRHTFKRCTKATDTS